MKTMMTTISMVICVAPFAHLPCREMKLRDDVCSGSGLQCKGRINSMRPTIILLMFIYGHSCAKKIDRGAEIDGQLKGRNPRNIDLN
jgi:hypothetical protein